MKNFKVILTGILFMLSLLPNQSIAQQRPLGKYVIITFEDTYKITMHATKRFYWIIPQDSVKNSNFADLLFDSPKNNLADCCKGIPTDPGIEIVTSQTDYKFDNSYNSDTDVLQNIIKHYRRELQIISKKWDSGQTETIKIFATPVQGIFCSSLLHLFGQKHYGYYGKIFMPYSTFSYDEVFWSTENASHLSHEDFAKIPFDIIQY